MIRESWFRKIIFSSFLLALIPASILIMFIPSSGNKYSIDIRQEIQTGKVKYLDLNSDTISERIEVHHNSSYYFISVRDHNMKWYDEWPFADSLNSLISGPFSGDYDSDGYNEIYVFSHKRDSLFISLYEILQPGSKSIERIYVDRCGFINGTLFSNISPAGFYDQNGDGFKEFYFSQSSGGRSGPRKVYYFDVANRLIFSCSHSAQVTIPLTMADMDKDTKPEIFGFTSASGNYPVTATYTDSSSWFMVYNEKLEFEFPPLEFKGFATGICPFPFYENYLVAFCNNGHDPRSVPSKLLICSPGGQILREKPVEELGINSSLYSPYVIGNSGVQKIFLKDDILISVDSSLNRSGFAKNHTNLNSYYLRNIDLNLDGTDELVLYSHDHGILLVFNLSLDLLCEKEFRAETNLWSVSSYVPEADKPETFVQSGDKGYFLTMVPNRLYYIGFLTWPGIYLLFLLFLIFVRKINTFQVVQREELKKRLLTLQLKGIKAQLDPHFTFNTFNSLASLIYLNDRQAAYDYMNKFSNLLRKMLNDAEKIYRTLGEEIDFVNTYLELEKLRFGDKFNYSIETGRDVSRNELVPKLVLHTFAENAVKHGIILSDKPVNLKICICKEKDHLNIIVEDNGAGMNKSKGRTMSTGMGLKLTSEFYQIISQITEKPISYVVRDTLDNNGNSCGTIVEIKVPLGLTSISSL